MHLTTTKGREGTTNSSKTDRMSSHRTWSDVSLNSAFRAVGLSEVGNGLVCCKMYGW